MAKDGKKAGIVLGLVGVVALALGLKAKAAPPEVDIRVENLVIEPAEVYVGEPVSISVTATNYGGISGSRIITYQVS